MALETSSRVEQNGDGDETTLGGQSAFSKDGSALLYVKTQPRYSRPQYSLQQRARARPVLESVRVMSHTSAPPLSLSRLEQAGELERVQH